jgi:outer membrane cobalamin receptor
VLTISSVGYQNLEVKVTGASLGSISLQSANGSLEEVVVTGYSAQRKKDIAGAVSIVDVASAKRVVATSAEQLLQGLAAGVTVITTGAPGSGSNVFVRGINNFGNTTPCL